MATGFHSTIDQAIGFAPTSMDDFKSQVAPTAAPGAISVGALHDKMADAQIGADMGREGLAHVAMMEGGPSLSGGAMSAMASGPSLPAYLSTDIMESVGRAILGTAAIGVMGASFAPSIAQPAAQMIQTANRGLDAVGLTQTAMQVADSGSQYLKSPIDTGENGAEFAAYEAYADSEMPVSRAPVAPVDRTPYKPKPHWWNGYEGSSNAQYFEKQIAHNEAAYDMLKEKAYTMSMPMPAPA